MIAPHVGHDAAVAAALFVEHNDVAVLPDASCPQPLTRNSNLRPSLGIGIGSLHPFLFTWS